VILVVSALIAADVSTLFEDVIPAPVPESPFPLLDETSADELDCKTDEDCAASEELDSSTALLSPPSGPELLESSPQATRLMHAKQANITENFES
jgi:hypothetical protein